MKDTKEKDIDIDKVTKALTLSDNYITPKNCKNPSCQYSGIMKKKARWSNLVLLLLFLCGILPAIIYWLFKRGYDYYCPLCGYKNI